MKKGLCVDEGGLFVCAPNPIHNIIDVSYKMQSKDGSESESND